MPLNEEQLQGRRNLEAEGFAARAQVAQFEERVLTQRRAIEARLADERQAGAEIAMLAASAQASEDFRAQAASERAEAEAITATRAQGVRCAQLREGLQVLTAPIDGIVNEISVTTIGEVVEAGAPMATIVPAGSELIVEALILNRDVGFVAPGQQVIVKLEAFPFTRHGYIEGMSSTSPPTPSPTKPAGSCFQPASASPVRDYATSISACSRRNLQIIQRGTERRRCAKQPDRTSGATPRLRHAPLPGMSAQVKSSPPAAACSPICSPRSRARWAKRGGRVKRVRGRLWALLGATVCAILLSGYLWLANQFPRAQEDTSGLGHQSHCGARTGFDVRGAGRLDLRTVGIVDGAAMQYHQRRERSRLR